MRGTGGGGRMNQLARPARIQCQTGTQQGVYHAADAAWWLACASSAHRCSSGSGSWRGPMAGEGGAWGRHSVADTCSGWCVSIAAGELAPLWVCRVARHARGRDAAHARTLVAFSNWPVRVSNAAFMAVQSLTVSWVAPGHSGVWTGLVWRRHGIEAGHGTESGGPLLWYRPAGRWRGACGTAPAGTVARQLARRRCRAVSHLDGRRGGERHEGKRQERKAGTVRHVG